jgi:hypothetical protein
MSKKYTDYTTSELASLSIEQAEELRAEAIKSRAELKMKYGDILSEWDNFNFYMGAFDAARGSEKSKPKKPKVTYLYMMRDERNGLTKIGRSVRPSERERTLQSEVPSVSLIWSVESLVHEEKELHRLYKDSRVRGEWFDLNESDVDYIKSLNWRK